MARRIELFDPARFDVGTYGAEGLCTMCAAYNCGYTNSRADYQIRRSGGKRGRVVYKAICGNHALRVYAAGAEWAAGEMPAPDYNAECPPPGMSYSEHCRRRERGV